MKNVGVDHRRFHVTVAEQLLDGANVISVGEQVGGKRMSKGVTSDPLRESGATGGSRDRPLHRTAVHMVAPFETGARVNADRRAREDKLPRPRAVG